MSIVAIIPARGGSRRIPMKNIRLFHGKPIIDYSITTARAAGLFSRIYVSTDSPAISSVAYRAGAEVIWRPDNLARDSVGTQEVAKNVIDTLIGDYRAIDPPKYVCCIYPTAPLMTYMDLIHGYSMLRVTGASFVYSVGPSFQDAGQWYWGTAEAFRTGVSLDEGAHYRLPGYRVCDINTEEDWQRAEQLYDNMLKGN